MTKKNAAVSKISQIQMRKRMRIKKKKKQANKSRKITNQKTKSQ